MLRPTSMFSRPAKLKWLILMQLGENAKLKCQLVEQRDESAYLRGRGDSPNGVGFPWGTECLSATVVLSPF